MNLSGKVVLITGGLSGIGASCVKELVANNVKGVVIADINDNEAVVGSLKDKYGEFKVTFIKTDISNDHSFENAFRKTIERYNNIDILINCAGIIDEIDWKRTIQVNLMGTTYGCLLAINKYFPSYKTSEEACIINISSIAGLAPTQVSPHYTTTKFGVVGLTRSLGTNKTIINRGIRTIVLCPGFTETPITQGSIPVVFKELVAEEIARLKPQKPESVAKGVMHLLQKAESGSVWVIVEGVLSKAELPVWENLDEILVEKRIV